MNRVVELAEDVYYSIRSEWPRYTILIVWCLVNFITFIVSFFYYKNALQFFYLREIVGDGIAWSRASAICLNLNSAILLILVCRNIISFIRTLLRFWPRIVRYARVIDKYITYHTYVGYTIVFFTIVHTLGHIHNVERFVEARDSTGLVSTLSLLGTLPNTSYINPVRVNNAIAIVETLKLVAGITGLFLCLALSILVSTSVEYIRRTYFNLFWYTHQLVALLYFALLGVHGLQQVIRHQINLSENDPQQCYLTFSRWPTRTCDIPQFAGKPASSWYWVISSLIVYSLERLIRLVRGLKQYKLAKVQVHPSDVIELRIENRVNDPSRIHYEAGQFVYLNVRRLAFFEWHPFTITSSPSDDYLSVHVRCAGDWTSELKRRLLLAEDNDKMVNQVSVDGPYGTCAEDVFKYERVVLIGAGIGVTPYASILKQIWHQMSSKRSDTTTNKLLRRVHFFWICSHIDSFEWFGELLQSLEAKWNSESHGHLEYKIYLTRGWSLKEARQIAINDNESRDLFTGLKQKTHYGRPNFDAFFKDLSSTDMNTTSQSTVDTGVFYCGPAQLSKQLHKICNKYSTNSARFVYNKENF